MLVRADNHGTPTLGRTRLKDSLIEPEDDGRGDADGGHVGVCASIEAGVDAAPIPEPPEYDLDLVAAVVERGVVWDRHHRKRAQRPVVTILVFPASAVGRRGGEHGRDGDRRILLSREGSG